MRQNYLILAIDTSCDETSVAITCADRVIANIVSSQVDLHAEYGGVVPNLAKRMHHQLIDPTLKKALTTAHLLQTASESIDAIAVTIGPGLAPALEEGIAKAKELALHWKKPLIAVNHMEAHLLSSFAKNLKGKGPLSGKKPTFPALGLLLSGGHTQLVVMHAIGSYTLLGETLDDAVGEAFDKVAKLLDLGYPGGPLLSELAKTGTPRYQLPVPMQGSDDLNFSFSGLKTACLYKLQQIKEEKTPQFYADFAASFQRVAIQSLIIKLEKAVNIINPKSILLGGGVISNLKIRMESRKIARKYHIPMFIPYHKKLFTDNAAMVGVCAWYQSQRGDFVRDIVGLERQPSLNFNK